MEEKSQKTTRHTEKNRMAKVHFLLLVITVKLRAQQKGIYRQNGWNSMSSKIIKLCVVYGALTSDLRTQRDRKWDSKKIFHADSTKIERLQKWVRNVNKMQEKCIIILKVSIHQEIIIFINIYTKNHSCTI